MNTTIDSILQQCKEESMNSSNRKDNPRNESQSNETAPHLLDSGTETDFMSIQEIVWEKKYKN